MNLSNSLARNASNAFSNALALPAEKLAIRNQYDGHVLATTLVPALLEAGYDSAHLRAEAVEDLRKSIQPQENITLLLNKFDQEVERFFLGQVTEIQIEAARTLFKAINVKPECKQGTPVEYTPTVTKGFKHTPSAMSGKRALRMLSTGQFPEVVRTHLKAFI